MSRTNKSRRISGWSTHHQTWAKRHGNKVARVSSRQRVKDLNVSVFEKLLEDIAADQLEERGALSQAMKLRNRNEPVLSTRLHDCW
jgi:hypothetical protein